MRTKYVIKVYNGRVQSVALAATREAPAFKCQGFDGWRWYFRPRHVTAPSPWFYSFVPPGVAAGG